MMGVFSTVLVLLLLASCSGLCLASEQLIELSYDGPATVDISLDIDVLSPRLFRVYVRHAGLVFRIGSHVNALSGRPS
jgi:hypothetical protein